MNSSKTISVIITAAGSSSRMGSGKKKEYLKYKKGTVLSHSILIFFKSLFTNPYSLKHIVVTCPKDGVGDAQSAVNKDSELKKLLKKQDATDIIFFTEGGETRQKSVYNALEFINAHGGTDVVLIHDGARPLIKEELVKEVADSVIQNNTAVVPGFTPVDTIKEIGADGKIVKHLERKKLFAVQTPQGFIFSQILEAHKKALKDKKEYTDDTEVFGHYCGSVSTVPGDPDNIKITYIKDLKALKS